MSATEPDKFLTDRIEATVDGEEVTIWNRLKVYVNHEVHATQIEHLHQVFAGDGSTQEEPEYITPEMADKLQSLDVYPDAEVVDPRDDDVVVI